MEYNSFKMERNDTAEAILPSEELSAFIQENNSSFYEKFNNKIMSEILLSQTDEECQPTGKVMWDELEKINNSYPETILPLPTSNSSNYQQNANETIHHMAEDKFAVVPMSVSDQNQKREYIVDSSPDTLLSRSGLAAEESPTDFSQEINIYSAAKPSLSTQPWGGRLNFNLILRKSEPLNSTNKWCYSEELGILFANLNKAVPISVDVSQWEPGSFINITPVFTEGQHALVPVPRCYNHASQDASYLSEHIVQVDNLDASYKQDEHGRHSVDIPLGSPPPGETTKQLFVKVGCWNTCVGGPCRKPFCLVFTLFTSTNAEIGRRIINVKICSCPQRDMKIALKNATKREGLPIKKSNTPSKKVRSGKKHISSSKRMKTESNELHPFNYEQMLVPLEFVPRVKQFINYLTAERHSRNHFPNLLPYPDV